MILKGHGLMYEGWPHDDRGERISGHPTSRGGPGRAMCSCGSLSPVLPSANKRREWHRLHKLYRARVEHP